MTALLRDNIFPLGFHCGHSFWNRQQLTSQFRQQPPPRPTYLRQLISTALRRDDADGLSAAELELLATMNQVLLQVGLHFLRSRDSRIGRRTLTIAGDSLELPELDKVLQHFLQLFPALPIELNRYSPQTFLDQTDSAGQMDELLLELFLLHVQSQNRAIRSGQALFHSEERQLRQSCNYERQLQKINDFLPRLDDGFAERPASLLERLSEPLQAPTLEGQLRRLKNQWGAILPERLRARISSAFAILDLEGVTPGFPAEPETTPLDPSLSPDQEYANFTVDLDWMPRTVLLAKSTYVWLQQLSHKYRWHIHRLDQIPDQELDQLAGYGFTSLWLIGVWKRSKASLKIKNLCGKYQVAASAYAIDDYQIADDLGGDDALENLRQRCRQRGIDLACDVVTNHTGIESAWLREHPDWFVQSTHPPYPGYRFNGPDLSESHEYALQIEDGYYDHSEASVVCRYQHRHSGQVRYLYHGNDGTHLPWNDTVQLNYLLPEVREAMIRLIVAVARRFRVIRFDAAMTLAKRHFQRLWFPLPGGGEGVPSRSDYAMEKAEFDRLFPIEFWRELVDRVRAEVPDTLLIAEAFWLMEGYFVRTLGMHRVYNSAFMNMLKREENEKYRQTLKNILAFDPAILQRFVNFMSNPDEKPAIEQFGNNDKYFCVATLLATMPGLPMFGHGQIEGYHEKYGMEYLAPQLREEPDQQLIVRHQQQIFPLLRQRALFSGAENFQLYDFVSEYGIEENVYAYSNRLGDRHTLIICNNSPHHIRGHIGSAVSRADGQGELIYQADHGDQSGDFCIFNDLSRQQQYLLPVETWQQGGQFSLQPYAYRVLVDFHKVNDATGHWQQLWQRYADQGRTDLYTDYQALLIEPALSLTAELRAIRNPGRAKRKTAQLLQQIFNELDAPGIKDLAAENFLGLLLNVMLEARTAPDAPLVKQALGQLTLESASSMQDFFSLLDRLFNQQDWRKLLKCNYYNEVDYFNQEAFDQLLSGFLLFLIFHSNNSRTNDSRELSNLFTQILMNMSRLQTLATKSHYKVDIFLHRLDSGPEPEPVLPAATGGDYTMKILFVTPEATPFAKTGGLADVAGSLPRALRQLGHDVRVAIPCHRSAERSGLSLRKGRKSVEVNLNGKNYRGSLKQTAHDGVPFWFIDCPEFFDRDPLYGTSEGDYPDNATRFGFFSRAVLEMIKRLDFRPDVIHLHDWQTSFIPVLLRTEYRRNPFYANIATLLTIHNLGYQGIFPKDILGQLGLHDSLATPKAMEFFGNLSVLKGGINYADVINTVSPTYCQEIQQTEQGHGFDGILRDRQEDLHGIINGLDSRSWDPALDTALPTPYNIDNLNGKRACKRYLQNELGLETRHDVPIVAVISRLDRQKGIDLIEQAWPELLERDIQFILLGSGDNEAMAFWQQQQKLRPGQVSINLTFDEGLSRRIFSASDILLVPSLYEPCGLTQMIALHYGALPVVRKTGGLADTVIDVNESPRTGYGFLFERSDKDELLAALDRALEIYPQRSRWLTLVKRGMGQDFSWTNSAGQYHELYTKARNYRQMPAA